MASRETVISSVVGAGLVWNATKHSKSAWIDGIMGESGYADAQFFIGLAFLTPIIVILLSQLASRGGGGRGGGGPKAA